MRQFSRLLYLLGERRNEGVLLMSPVAVSLISFIILIACASGVHALETVIGGRKGVRH